MIYQTSIQNAEERINWYRRKKKILKIISKSLVFFSLFFTVIGISATILNILKIFDNSFLAQSGYIFLAVAALIKGSDSYFSISSGFRRSLTAEVNLEQVLREYKNDKNDLESNQLSALIFLRKSRDFTNKIESIVAQETNNWAAEFGSNRLKDNNFLKYEANSKETLKETIDAKMFDKKDDLKKRTITSLDLSDKKSFLTLGGIGLMLLGMILILAVFYYKIRKQHLSRCLIYRIHPHWL